MDMIVVLTLLSLLIWQLSQTVPTPQPRLIREKYDECVSGIDEIE
jgi:hypothetical protein